MSDFLAAIAAQFDAEPPMADHELDALPSTLEAMEDAADGLVCARCPLAPDQHPDEIPDCRCVETDRDTDTLGCPLHAETAEGRQWNLDHPDGISAEELEAMAQYAYESCREEGCR